MFAALQINGEFFTSHFIVVLIVGLAFFLVQIALTVRICGRARRQERLLMRLRRDFEQGGSGRDSGDTAGRRWSWLQWVMEIFPSGATTAAGNYSREDVLQELDTRIASSSDYLLLQRMGIMAPLLGVVLTVAGFYWLQIEEFDEQSLSSILLTVTPLISGVGAGALLALINQALLHVASRRLESLRMSSRAWFDAVLWSQADLDTQSATVDAVRSMKQLAVSMNSAASQYSAGGNQLHDSAASLQETASQFRRVGQSFSDQMKGIPEALDEVRRTTSAAAAALEELIHVGSRTVANLDVSVSAFRTALDREFAPAAELHLRSSKLFTEAAQQIGDATALLKSGSHELKRTVQANAESYQMMDESLRRHVVPGNRRIYDAAQALTDQVADLMKIVQELSGITALVNARADADRFVAQTGQISNAPASLPAQEPEALERNDADGVDASKSVDRFKSRVAGKPR